MKTIILSIFVFALASCGKKEWSKEYLVAKCDKEFKKQKETRNAFNETQLKELCDCVAGKMSTRYKSEAEADKDIAGSTEIGRECAMQIMKTE